MEVIVNQIARNLRRRQTDTERLLWSRLRNRQLAGYKFRRQHPIGRFVVDLVCLDVKLIVEVDGGQHAERHEEDQQRTAFMQQAGFRVLRFWNNDVLNNTEAVLDAIRNELVKGPS